MEDLHRSYTSHFLIARDKDEFGQITPANGQKWNNTEWSQGRFSYGSGDAIANIAKQTRQLLRCHTLAWYNQLPGYGEAYSSYPDIATDRYPI